MALEDNTKKDLANMVRELEAKLKEMKPVEKQLTAKVDELKQLAIGLHRDENGKYHLVKIKFDAPSKAAGVDDIVDLSTTDPAIAFYNINKYVSEVIMRKLRGGKYD
jgi:hypothetical protein